MRVFRLGLSARRSAISSRALAIDRRCELPRPVGWRAFLSCPCFRFPRRSLRDRPLPRAPRARAPPVRGSRRKNRCRANFVASASCSAHSRRPGLSIGVTKGLRGSLLNPLYVTAAYRGHPVGCVMWVTARRRPTCVNNWNLGARLLKAIRQQVQTSHPGIILSRMAARLAVL
jgi:hypothetical protein